MLGPGIGIMKMFGMSSLMLAADKCFLCAHSLPLIGLAAVPVAAFSKVFVAKQCDHLQCAGREM